MLPDGPFAPAQSVPDNVVMPSTSNGDAVVAPPCLEITVGQKALSPPMDWSALAYFHFGDTRQANGDGLAIQTGLQALESEPLVQYWITDEPVQRGQYETVNYVGNRHVLFGYIHLPVRGGQDNFQQLTERAYGEIYRCLAHTGCNHLLRTWNYFPHITDFDDSQGKVNRYEQFCCGRLRAMQKYAIGNSPYPAATVIGNHSDRFHLGFLASDTAGIGVENPRQTSAHHYPVTNALNRPLFSRGILKEWRNCTHFYVSGTASIVGHETQHTNDVGAQLDEAISNVERLVEHVNVQHRAQLHARDNLLYVQVYIRHGTDTSRIKQVLAERLPGATSRVLLQGEMCRDNLLVEIEAAYQRPSTARGNARTS